MNIAKHHKTMFDNRVSTLSYCFEHGFDRPPSVFFGFMGLAVGVFLMMRTGSLMQLLRLIDIRSYIIQKFTP